MRIYQSHPNRPIRILPGSKEEVLGSLRSLSADCRENVLMLEQELRTQDPDPDERCGLLGDRYEVFALAIPQCARYRLAISADVKQDPPPILIHGAVPAGRACSTAHRLALRQRRLINPTWET